MKRILSYCVVAVCSLVSAVDCRAEITWLPTQSTWGDSNTPFASLPGAPSGTGAVNIATGPYGFGFNSSGIYAFGFTNAIPSSFTSNPLAAETELSSTVLAAGTKVVLKFQKGADDRLNYLALVADPTQQLDLRITGSTSFEIHATIVNPVDSVTAQNVGAVFGMMIDSTSDNARNFGGTLFATNMHYRDIEAPDSVPTGAASIKANGINGTSVDFYAFIPLPVAQQFGLNTSDPSVPDALGYIDGTQVAAANFQNLGLDSALGFNFNDPSNNPNNTVLKLKVSNDSWSAHNIQFGKIPAATATPTPTSTPVATATAVPTVVPTPPITPEPTITPDQSGPTISLTGKEIVTTKANSISLKGSVSDPSGVKTLQYSLTSKTKGYKAVKISGGGWTIKIKNLVKGKTAKVYLRATDNLNNVSAVKVVQIKRK